LSSAITIGPGEGGPARGGKSGRALLMNDAIHAELAVRYDRIEDLDGLPREAGIEGVPVPRTALISPDA